MAKIKTSDFEDQDWDAVEEMVHSGWNRKAAIKAVRETLDHDAECEKEKQRA